MDGIWHKHCNTPDRPTINAVEWAAPSVNDDRLAAEVVGNSDKPGTAVRRHRRRTGKDAWNRKVSGVFFCFLNRFSQVLLMNSNVAALNKLQPLVVIGNGMVGHHCVEQLIEKGALEHYRIHVLDRDQEGAGIAAYLWRQVRVIRPAARPAQSKPAPDHACKLHTACIAPVNG